MGLFRHFSVCSVVLVRVLLFGSGRFVFLFGILGSSLRLLGGLLRSCSIRLRYWCTYLCRVFGSCNSHTSPLFHGIFDCVSIFKTRFAAQEFFIVFVSFILCLFSWDFYESWWVFFFESQYEWSRCNIFGFYHISLVHSHRLQYPGCYSRGCR